MKSNSVQFFFGTPGNLLPWFVGVLFDCLCVRACVCVCVLSISTITQKISNVLIRKKPWLAGLLKLTNYTIPSRNSPNRVIYIRNVI